MRPNENPAAKVAGREVQRRVNPMKDLIQSADVQSKFAEILGEKAKAYLASVLQTVQQSPELVEAEPKSVLTAAMIAATLDLPIDKNLGFSAIVPYRDKGRPIAQFQIMTRGYVQLAQRTGQYESINVVEIYDDELKGFDILTGEAKIEPKEGGWRDKAWAGNVEADKHIAGYAGTFKLLSGFKKMEYWPVAKIDAHGKRFSKSFAYAGSPWQSNRESMRKKTVLKAMLKAWGPMSTSMQQAERMDATSGSSMNLHELDHDEAYEPIPEAVEAVQQAVEGAVEPKDQVDPEPKAEAPAEAAKVPESELF